MTKTEDKPMSVLYESLEQTHRAITLLLKGGPGTGKTWKMAHLPDLVLFNFDNNVSGLRRLPKSMTDSIRFVNPRMKNGKKVPGPMVWDNFVAQLTKVLADDTVKNLAIDTLTTMQDILYHKILKTDSPTSAMKIQHWGEMQRYLKWFAEAVLQANDLDKNVIIAAHEVSMQDANTQAVQYVLNLGGSMKDNFDLYFTDCWRCYTQLTGSGKVVHRVRTLPGSNFAAKCSLDLPADFVWEEQSAEVIKQFSL